jgi:integrase
MRYDEIRRHVREHFTDLLAKFREAVSVDGPVVGPHKDALTSSQALAGEPLGDFLAVTALDGGDALLSAFCESRGITEDLDPAKQKQMLNELYKGYKIFLDEALQINASFDGFDLSPEALARPSGIPSQSNQTAVTEVPYQETVRRYMDEGKRAQSWVLKTIDEKQDALELLGEITGNIPTASLSKSDVGSIKDVLMKMPKNRKKNPATRDLALAAMLEVPGMQAISPTTVNGYLSNFQSFFDWAVKNGCATENIFSGVRLRQNSRAATNARKAFSDDALRNMYLQLTENPDGLVHKDDMKWPTLVAMFTGARVNEVSQLHTSDIRKEGEVWCIDINDDGEKTLKNAPSKRLVPVHDQLIELGLLDFVNERRTGISPRLFPSFSYSAKNGYGRNVGRWFNDKFLPELGLKEAGLVFHSFRHTMVTKLSRGDVAEGMVKAIIGHEQSGVTHTSYFKAGYSPEQLKAAINRFHWLGL